ncbi:mannitol dehydrogenase family protein [Microbacterium pseudoresistens]|uniref:Mannitol-1-phosphate 5-dehydrogenase n=1 Tax=Microbacterium pseudoresistens TaxID=640634 RepID=A0A7Y9JNB3_9MICO|nr:mannitol dehydrogenase family protein [Microbacterium pseudoresistens]NYD53514.1 mannitol 2-dehydrogenase [Microbacterium pseudoresistens]
MTGPIRPETATVRLSRATLRDLPAEVAVPDYLDDETPVGVVHIGVGNFHRSHQAMYLDRLLAARSDGAVAICGIGVRPEDRPLLMALQEQTGLYSLSLFAPDGTVDTRIIGSLRNVLLLPDAPDDALARLCDPEVRIVSLTITESGYVEDATTGRRAADDRAVRVETADGLTTPQTAFGLIVAALRARRTAGTSPFTVMSCDNIQRNGAIARASVVETARLVDPDLADWIDGNVAFPSTMVDRITPSPTPSQLALVDGVLGLRDKAPVVAEPFVQWILEDDFPSGRPPLEDVGAIFTDDIGSYESMKLRLLNGAHQVLAYVGLLRGHRFAHEAVADPVVRHWLDVYWRELALPTLDLPDGVDGDDYLRTLLERFGNPAIADTLERLATDSSARMAKFVLPVLVDARDRPGFAELTAVILESWVTAVRSSSSDLISSGVPSDVHAAIAGGSPLLSAVDWLRPLSADPALSLAMTAVRETFDALGPSEGLERLLSQAPGCAQEAS